MAGTTGDGDMRDMRRAVEREMRERGEREDDLVGTVGEEQRRLREAAGDAAEDEDEDAG